MSKKVLIAAPVHPILIETLENSGYDCTVNEKIGQEEAKSFLQDCEGLVTSTRLHINKEIIDVAKQLKWIGRMGSGMEIIDVPYARAQGIACYSSPEGNSNAVAEHALGMLLSLNKKINKSSREVEQGLWKRTENRGVELEGKTIGIIGFGHTGSSFAKKLQGFELNILAYDKGTDKDIPTYVTQCDSLEHIYENADIVSFHVPLQADTKHYFNQSFVDKMVKDFVLVNTSRGEVVDTECLMGALQSGKVTGACLDVWEEEPISKMSDVSRSRLEKMVAFGQVIITPHIAGYSKEALYKMSKILVERIVN